jgi:two-component system phosphate regulon sensor histidine kinase PhoR
MFRSIRWRIALAFTALIIVSLIGLSIFITKTVREHYIETLETQLTSQALLVGDSISPYLAAGDTITIDMLSKQYGEQVNTRITIIGSDGTVLGDTYEDPAAMENHGNRPEVKESLVNSTGSNIRYSATLGYNMLYVAVPIYVDNVPAGTARVSIPLTSVEQSLRRINVAIVIGACIAAAVAILLAFWITRVITGPVKTLTRMSRKISEGHLDQKIHLTSHDEIGELATVFNHMAEQLKTTVDLLTGQRDRLAVLLAHIGDGIIVTDRNAIVTLINRTAEKIFHTENDKAQGCTFIELVRDHEIDEIMQRCIETGEKQTGLVHYRAKRLFLGVIVTLLPDKGGCIVLLQDLTELRRLETIRRDFISNISHELRTPLSSIKALAETLKEGAIEDKPVAKDFLERIDGEVDRLAQMVQELSDLSRIESGEAPLQKSFFDASDVMTTVVQRMQAQADRAGVSLTVDASQQLPRIHGDRYRIEQVLVNLIHNAIKFTPAGGRITASGIISDGFMQFSVTDTGEGIPADDLNRIFERFYKADKARTGSGTGLGLAIAKHVVAAHGGNIWVESKEGKGSTFFFTIPLASKD